MKYNEITLFLVWILLLSFLTGCHWFKRRGELFSKTNTAKVRYHYIKPGETLWNIARKYKVNLDYLIQINHIQHPDRLRVGTRILIPNTSHTYSYSSKNRKHTSSRQNQNKKNIKRTITRHSSHSTSTVPFSDSTFKKYKGKFVFPLQEKGILVLKFHEDKLLYKEGISYSLKKASPVRAIYSGVVEYAGSEIEGYGNTIIISHSDDYYSLYAFLDKINVEIGKHVQTGEIIGTTGKKFPQDKNYYFHFQLRKGVNSVNPLPYFK
jgi:murein DD-endopeptidase MepM/ murein hydrolase activator NlpD